MSLPWNRSRYSDRDSQRFSEDVVQDMRYLTSLRLTNVLVDNKARPVFSFPRALLVLVERGIRLPAVLANPLSTHLLTVLVGTILS